MSFGLVVFYYIFAFIKDDINSEITNPKTPF